MSILRGKKSVLIYMISKPWWEWILWKIYIPGTRRLSFRSSGLPLGLPTNELRFIRETAKKVPPLMARPSKFFSLQKSIFPLMARPPPLNDLAISGGTFFAASLRKVTIYPEEASQ